MSNDWFEQMMEDPANKVDGKAWVVFLMPKAVIENGKKYGDIHFKMVTGEAALK